MPRSALPALALACALLACGAAHADEIRLRNGDKLSGDLHYEDLDKLIIRSPVYGDVKVPRGQVASYVKGTRVIPKPPDPPPPPKPRWRGEVALGADSRSGNTSSSDYYATARAQKRTPFSESDGAFEAFYGQIRRRMSTQRYYGMGRFALKFGPKRRFNVFVKFEGDHDRFANIDYRLVPSLGLGYRFADAPDWKALTELGLGYSLTRFREGREDIGEIVLVPRIFLERRVWGQIRLSEDFKIYPSLKDTGGYRFRSETVLTNRVSPNISIRLSFINDYNSEPQFEGVKRNDSRLVAALAYAF